MATAPGRGGIGIVRLSGADLAPLGQSIAGLCPRPRMAARATFRDAGGARIDEGLVLFFPAPNSYTGEDVLELQGHGGPVVLQLLLQRCLELGARLAEPGEFTRRAFLNGKLDLAQAEAVADLIEASTGAAARSAARSLAGEFSAAVDGVSRHLIDLRMLVEGSLDFPEEDVDFLGEADAAGRLRGIQQAVAALQRRARQGGLLRRGLRVVLAGQPNAGKSSLLNRLAGEERAIVTAVAGTTRDALRETISIHGIPLHVVDTAGLRDTTDEVERMGVSRAWQEIAAADVVLLVLDARTGEVEADLEIIARLPAGIPRIDILNKVDLAGRPAERMECDGRVTIALSAKTGAGVEHLEPELLRVAGWFDDAEDVFMARARHLEALSVARRRLDAAWEALATPDLLAEELRLAHDALASIVGKFSADDLLGEIFSRFCIGK